MGTVQSIDRTKPASDTSEAPAPLAAEQLTDLSRLRGIAMKFAGKLETVAESLDEKEEKKFLLGRHGIVQCHNDIARHVMQLAMLEQETAGLRPMPQRRVFTEGSVSGRSGFGSQAGQAARPGMPQMPQAYDPREAAEIDAKLDRRIAEVLAEIEQKRARQAAGEPEPEAPPRPPVELEPGEEPAEWTEEDMRQMFGRQYRPEGLKIPDYEAEAVATGPPVE